MKIDGYELDGIAYIRGDGPMWRTTTHDGRAGLVTLHTRADAQLNSERWQLWAGIEHPHIVRLLDVVSHTDGRWALVQEEICGESLAILISQKDEKLRVHGAQIIDHLSAAVDVLHRHGIIHGDLSPQNVLITADNEPVIIDLIGSLCPESGTPGWSDSDTGITGDRIALSKLREEIMSLSQAPDPQLSSHPQDPGLRLRCQSALPQTQKNPRSYPHWGALFASQEEKLPKQAAASKPATPRRILIVGMALSLLILTGGAVRALQTPATEELLGPQFEAKVGQNSIAPPRPPDPEAPAPMSHSVQQSQNPSAVQSCPTDEEVIDRARAIMRARDYAYNHLDAQGLERFLGSELLNSDVDQIRTMKEANVTVQGFTTSMTNIDPLGCANNHVKLQVMLSAHDYSHCDQHGCATVRGTGGQGNHVALTMSLPELLLDKVDSVESARS